MTRLLSIALLAGTLSAQDVPMRPQTLNIKMRDVNCNQWHGYRRSLEVHDSGYTNYGRWDGNGALEAFYLQKPEKTYYWYSLQQEIAMCDIAESNGRPCVRKTVRVNGIDRTYTEITHAKKPWGYWPDYRPVTVSKGGN